MDVFDLRKDLSMTTPATPQLHQNRRSTSSGKGRSALEDGALWPEPLLQLNPTFRPAVPLTISSKPASFTRVRAHFPH
jgi:hypothetical protein